MGKKVITKSSKSEKKPTEVEAEPDSIAVEQKKANEKKIRKQISAMQAKVTECVDLKQMVSAVKALKTFSKRQQASAAERALLTDEDQTISVNFTMTRVPTNPSPKPQMIKIDHPYVTEDQHSRICVIVKDPARAFKDQIQDLNVPCIAKVIGLDKLRRNFKQFKDKRQLLKDYDSFLADLRVYKMLPELMGKEFYQRKKYPCPVKLHGLEGGSKALQSQLNAAAASTFFMLGNGPNYSIKVGKTFQKEKEVAQNAMQALGHALAYATVHDDIDFDSVCQITVRVGASPELPVYNHFDSADLAAYMQD